MMAEEQREQMEPEIYESDAHIEQVVALVQVVQLGIEQKKQEVPVDYRMKGRMQVPQTSEDVQVRQLATKHTKQLPPPDCN